MNNILSAGLQPRIGENSRLVNEPEKAVYLCQAENLGKWRALLDIKTPVILQVLVPEEDVERSYQPGEFLVKKNIAPVNIKIVNDIQLESISESMTQLMVDYEMNLCFIVISIVRCCYYFTNNKSDNEYYKRYMDPNWQNYLIQTAASYKWIIDERLDFSKADKEKVKAAIVELDRSGEYTIDNTWLDTGRYIYQQLLEFDEPVFEETRKMLYDLIQRNYADVVGPGKGGFTD